MSEMTHNIDTGLPIMISSKEERISLCEKAARTVIFLYFCASPVTSLLSFIGINALLPGKLVGIINYGIVFYMFAMFINAKKSRFPIDIVIVYLVYVSILLISFLFDSNAPFLLSRITEPSLLLKVMPAVFVFRFCDNPGKMLKWASQASIIAILCTMIVYFGQGGYAKSADSYMTFAYSLVFPWGFVFYRAISNKSKSLFTFAIATAIILAVYGNRGVLISILAFIFYCVFIFTPKSKKKTISILILFVASGLLIYFFDDIIKRLILLSNALGLESRNLLLINLSSFTIDSGRNDIITPLLTEILHHPLAIRGMGADEAFFGLSGNYAHNAVIEIAFDFGVPIAMFLTALYAKIGLLIFDRKANNEWRMLFAIYFVIGLPIMMLSGSPFSSYYLFAAISIYMGYRKSTKSKGVGYDKERS